jgi:3-oxoacyl-[acyl-carrier protein] reductase
LTGPTGRRFDGRVALVTGAAGTLGTAISRRLATEGAAIVAVDKSRRRTDELIEQLTAAHDVPILGRAVDVADRPAVDAMLADVTAGLGPVDILVNNAAENPLSSDFDLDAEVFERVLAVDLVACWYLIRRTIGPMRERGWGSIVNISSVAAYYGGRGTETPYSASKAALQEITRAIGIQGGPYGIRCNAVACGLIESKFTEFYRDRLVGEVDRTPLRRHGRPEEVASVVAFLASEESSYVTAEVINVSGGWYLTV